MFEWECSSSGVFVEFPVLISVGGADVPMSQAKELPENSHIEGLLKAQSIRQGELFDSTVGVVARIQVRASLCLSCSTSRQKTDAYSVIFVLKGVRENLQH